MVVASNNHGTNSLTDGTAMDVNESYGTTMDMSKSNDDCTTKTFISTS